MAAVDMANGYLQEKWRVREVWGKRGRCAPLIIVTVTASATWIHTHSDTHTHTHKKKNNNKKTIHTHVTLFINPRSLFLCDTRSLPSLPPFPPSLPYPSTFLPYLSTFLLPFSSTHPGGVAGWLGGSATVAASPIILIWLN